MLYLSVCAEGKLTIEEIINKLLFATDNEGKTMFDEVTKLGKLDLLQELSEWTE